MPQQAAAFDAFLLVGDPFKVSSIANWWDLGSDQNTRVVLFAANLQLNQGQSPSTVVITLVDGNGQTHNVPAEAVHALPDAGLTQVTFRLPDALAAGTCSATLSTQGRVSNTSVFRVTQ
jgi:hypothetical protein